MRCSPRNLRAEAARVLPRLMARPLQEAVRVLPLAFPLLLVAQPVQEAARGVPQVEGRQEEAVAAGPRTFRFSLERTCRAPCKASCKLWACWKKERATTATSKIGPPTKRSRNRSRAE